MKKIFLKTLYFIFIRVLRIFKPISIGVRVMLVRDDQILLVKHSYMDEWYFPGGGTKRKETLADAARREALEEVGATLGNLELFGIYTNFFEVRTDTLPSSFVGILLTQAQKTGRSNASNSSPSMPCPRISLPGSLDGSQII